MADSPAIRLFGDTLVGEFLQDPLLSEGLLPAVIERYTGMFDAATGQSTDTKETISDSQTRAVDAVRNPAIQNLFADFDFGQDQNVFVVVRCPNPVLKGDLLTVDNERYRIEAVADIVRARAVFLAICKSEQN